MPGKLVTLSKDGRETKAFPVVSLHVFIGSEAFCDLRIKHKEISPQHCLITAQKDKPALIRNLSRTSPTLVNGAEVGTQDVELQDQDVITVRHRQFKWFYDVIPTPSESSFPSVNKGRKSWPLFANKLVAVVPPQRRDKDNELPVKKRRATLPNENTESRSKKSTPKVLAIKSGVKGARKLPPLKKSSIKISPSIEKRSTGTPYGLPLQARKSVKFLDTHERRLGKRGNMSYGPATPYRPSNTPVRTTKDSLYFTPPSTIGSSKKPMKSILKTPASTSVQIQTSVPILADLSTTPPPLTEQIQEESRLQTPPREETQTLDVVMRMPKRSSASKFSSPESTPRSATKAGKRFREDDSLLASERAAKKLKEDPPKAIDKKKMAALLQCHRKSLTPHPEVKVRRRIFLAPLGQQSQSKKKGRPRKSEPLAQASPAGKRALRFGSLGYSDAAPLVPKRKKTPFKAINFERKLSLPKPSVAKMISTPSPPSRKMTRATRAARASQEPRQRGEVTDVLSALDLSRKNPLSPDASGLMKKNTSPIADFTNVSGIKKLFSTEKTVDVRELFLEVGSDSSRHTSSDSSRKGVGETVSRRSSLLKNTKSLENLHADINSFNIEGVHELPASPTSSVGSPLQNISSTSRRSLTLKGARSVSLSSKDSSSLSLLAQNENTKLLRSSKDDVQNSVGSMSNYELDNLFNSPTGSRNKNTSTGDVFSPFRKKGRPSKASNANSTSTDIINQTMSTKKRGKAVDRVSSSPRSISLDNSTEQALSDESLNFTLGSLNASQQMGRISNGSQGNVSLRSISSVASSPEVTPSKSSEVSLKKTSRVSLRRIALKTSSKGLSKSLQQLSSVSHGSPNLVRGKLESSFPRRKNSRSMEVQIKENSPPKKRRSKSMPSINTSQEGREQSLLTEDSGLTRTSSDRSIENSNQSFGISHSANSLFVEVGSFRQSAREEAFSDNSLTPGFSKSLPSLLASRSSPKSSPNIFFSAGKFVKRRQKGKHLFGLCSPVAVRPTRSTASVNISLFDLDNNTSQRLPSSTPLKIHRPEKSFKQQCTVKNVSVPDSDGILHSGESQQDRSVLENVSNGSSNIRGKRSKSLSSSISRKSSKNNSTSRSDKEVITDKRNLSPVKVGQSTPKKLKATRSTSLVDMNLFRLDEDSSRKSLKSQKEATPQKSAEYINDSGLDELVGIAEANKSRPTRSKSTVDIDLFKLDSTSSSLKSPNISIRSRKSQKSKYDVLLKSPLRSSVIEHSENNLTDTEINLGPKSASLMSPNIRSRKSQKVKLHDSLKLPLNTSVVEHSKNHHTSVLGNHKDSSSSSLKSPNISIRSRKSEKPASPQKLAEYINNSGLYEIVETSEASKSRSTRSKSTLDIDLFKLDSTSLSLKSPNISIRSRTSQKNKNDDSLKSPLRSSVIEHSENHPANVEINLDTTSSSLKSPNISIRSRKSQKLELHHSLKLPFHTSVAEHSENHHTSVLGKNKESTCSSLKSPNISIRSRKSETPVSPQKLAEYINNSGLYEIVETSEASKSRSTRSKSTLDIDLFKLDSTFSSLKSPNISIRSRKSQKTKNDDSLKSPLRSSVIGHPENHPADVEINLDTTSSSPKSPNISIRSRKSQKLELHHSLKLPLHTSVVEHSENHHTSVLGKNKESTCSSLKSPNISIKSIKSQKIKLSDSLKSPLPSSVLERSENHSIDVEMKADSTLSSSKSPHFSIRSRKSEKQATPLKSAEFINVSSLYDTAEASKNRSTRSKSTVNIDLFKLDSSSSSLKSPNMSRKSQKMNHGDSLKSPLPSSVIEHSENRSTDVALMVDDKPSKTRAGNLSTSLKIKSSGIADHSKKTRSKSLPSVNESVKLDRKLNTSQFTTKKGNLSHKNSRSAEHIKSVIDSSDFPIVETNKSVSFLSQTEHSNRGRLQKTLTENRLKNKLPQGSSTDIDVSFSTSQVDLVNKSVKEGVLVEDSTNTSAFDVVEKNDFNSSTTSQKGRKSLNNKSHIETNRTTRSTISVDINLFRLDDSPLPMNVPSSTPFRRRGDAFSSESLESSNQKSVRTLSTDKQLKSKRNSKGQSFSGTLPLKPTRSKTSLSINLFDLDKKPLRTPKVRVAKKLINRKEKSFSEINRKTSLALKARSKSVVSFHPDLVPEISPIVVKSERSSPEIPLSSTRASNSNQSPKEDLELNTSGKLGTSTDGYQSSIELLNQPKRPTRSSNSINIDLFSLEENKSSQERSFDLHEARNKSNSRHRNGKKHSLLQRSGSSIKSNNTHNESPKKSGLSPNKTQKNRGSILIKTESPNNFVKEEEDNLSYVSDDESSDESHKKSKTTNTSNIHTSRNKSSIVLSSGNSQIEENTKHTQTPIAADYGNNKHSQTIEYFSSPIRSKNNSRLTTSPRDLAPVGSSRGSLLTVVSPSPKTRQPLKETIDESVSIPKQNDISTLLGTVSSKGRPSLLKENKKMSHGAKTTQTPLSHTSEIPHKLISPRSRKSQTHVTPTEPPVPQPSAELKTTNNYSPLSKVISNQIPEVSSKEMHRRGRSRKADIDILKAPNNIEADSKIDTAIPSTSFNSSVVKRQSKVKVLALSIPERYSKRGKKSLGKTIIASKILKRGRKAKGIDSSPVLTGKIKGVSSLVHQRGRKARQEVTPLIVLNRGRKAKAKSPSLPSKISKGRKVKADSGPPKIGKGKKAKSPSPLPEIRKGRKAKAESPPPKIEKGKKINGVSPSRGGKAKLPLPSPKIGKGKKAKEASPPRELTRGRKAKLPSPPPKIERGRKAKSPSPPPKIRKGKKAKEASPPRELSRGRKAKSPSPPPKIGKGNKVKEPPPPPRELTRGRKAKSPSPPPKIERGRKAKSPSPPPKIERGRKAKSPSPPPKTGKGRRAKSPSPTPKIERGRKAKSPSPPPKTGKGNKVKEPPPPRELTRGKKAKSPSPPPKIGKGKKVKEVSPPQKLTRGRKGNAESSPPKVGKEAKKTKEESPQKSTRGRRKVNGESSPPNVGREKKAKETSPPQELTRGRKGRSPAPPQELRKTRKAKAESPVKIEKGKKPKEASPPQELTRGRKVKPESTPPKIVKGKKSQEVSPPRELTRGRKAKSPSPLPETKKTRKGKGESSPQKIGKGGKKEEAPPQELPRGRKAKSPPPPEVRKGKKFKTESPPRKIEKENITNEKSPQKLTRGRKAKAKSPPPMIGKVKKMKESSPARELTRGRKAKGDSPLPKIEKGRKEKIEPLPTEVEKRKRARVASPSPVIEKRKRAKVASPSKVDKKKAAGRSGDLKITERRKGNRKTKKN